VVDNNNDRNENPIFGGSSNDENASPALGDIHFDLNGSPLSGNFGGESPNDAIPVHPIVVPDDNPYVDGVGYGQPDE